MLRIIDRPPPNLGISCSMAPSAGAQVVLHSEDVWRSGECLRADPAPAVAARWSSDSAWECKGTEASDWVVVSVFLRAVRATICVDGEGVHDGLVPSGSALVTLPGHTVQARFEGATESIQLYLSTAFLAEHGGDDAARLLSVEGGLPLVRDEAIEKLTRTLLVGHETGCTAGCAEKLGGPIAARVALLHRALAEQSAGRKVRFPLWRVQKVQDYVEAHLTDTITLADIAAAAGLSPMHFAAQFRAATGHRPHDFVQLRRVERAKVLLMQSGAPMIDIAIEVGFRTQAHFATVFKKFAGQTPTDWRDQKSSR